MIMNQQCLHNMADTDEVVKSIIVVVDDLGDLTIIVVLDVVISKEGIFTQSISIDVPIIPTCHK
jgi:hypothetical protein